MSTENVVNPGVVNVADQADGPLSVEQCVQTGPSQNPGPLTSGSGAGPALGAPANQAVTVGPTAVGKVTVDGGVYSPTKADCIDTTENNVVNQTYGSAWPENVYP